MNSPRTHCPDCGKFLYDDAVHTCNPNKKARAVSYVYRPLADSSKAIFDLLAERPGLTRREIEAALGLSERTVRHALYRAHRRGEVIQDRTHGRWNYKYSIGVLWERQPPAKTPEGKRAKRKVKAESPPPERPPKVTIRKERPPKPVEPKPEVKLPKPVKDPPMVGRDGKKMDRTKKWEPPKPPPQPEIIWPANVKVTVHPTTYTKLDPRAHIK